MTRKPLPWTLPYDPRSGLPGEGGEPLAPTALPLGFDLTRNAMFVRSVNAPGTGRTLALRSAIRAHRNPWVYVADPGAGARERWGAWLGLAGNEGPWMATSADEAAWQISLACRAVSERSRHDDGRGVELRSTLLCVEEWDLLYDKLGEQYRLAMATVLEHGPRLNCLVYATAGRYRHELACEVPEAFQIVQTRHPTGPASLLRA